MYRGQRVTVARYNFYGYFWHKGTSRVGFRRNANPVLGRRAP